MGLKNNLQSPVTAFSTSSRAARSRRVTLAHVASASGLARTTVSDILNRDAGERYGEATRQRVHDAVARLGYAPNRAAQIMAQGRTGMIGLMLTQGFSNPFWTRLAGTVQRELRQRDYRMQLALVDGGDPEEELRLVRQLHSDQVEGLIVGPVYESLDLDIHRNVFRGRLPIVTFGSAIGCEFDSVGLDHAAGVRLALEHLLALGHRRIGCLAVAPSRLAPDKPNLDNEAVKVFAGLDIFDSRWFFWQADTGRFEEVAALVAAFTDRWLAADVADRPTAMLCHNDQAAMTALSVLSQRGLRVPVDLSLVGYDNLPESAYLVPPLTTVENHADRQIAAAVELLSSRLANPQRKAQTRLIAPELITRATTARVA